MPLNCLFDDSGRWSVQQRRLSLPKWLAVGMSLLVACQAMPLSAQNEGTPEAQAAVDFQAEVRPILSDTCYKCHGPSEGDREAGLRLDVQSGVLDTGAVVPGDLEASELFQRINSDDPDMLMPPPDSGRKLTARQKEILKRWIQQGANWESHWSLIPPKRPELPTLRSDLASEWATNSIDQFIAARLEAEKLQPSPVANRTTLIRRVCFDLTGLPPEPELLARFESSSDEDWYEQLVDELLARPAYGEHMARYWLDAARYGDTHGLHLDNYREMWPYRDWVIDAFNRNLSYRDFTIQQLAGDMLPDATDQQKIASGFNRAHVTTNEGGSIEEEVYVRNVVDRVSTTGTVFMGLTVGCAQCHDHKFDPISQREFYQLFAYFNNMTDPPMDQNIKNPAPFMKVMTEEQRARQRQLIDAEQQAIAELDRQVDQLTYVDPGEPDADNATDHPEDSQQPIEFRWITGGRFPQGANVQGAAFETVPAAKLPVEHGVESRKQTGEGTTQHFFTDATLPITAQSGDVLFADVYLDPDNPPEEIMLQFNDGSWDHRAYWGANKVDFGTTDTPGRLKAGELPEVGKWVRLKIEAEKIGFSKSRPINGFAFTQFGGTAYWNSAGIISSQPQQASFESLARWSDFLRENPSAVPDKLKKTFQQPVEEWKEEQRLQVRRYFLLNVFEDSVAKLAPAVTARNQAKREREQFEAQLPTTMISVERDDIKEAFVLNRGEYDQQGDPVTRATPAALPSFPADLPNNRLGLAKWLTADDHPLTARVAVNRFWQQLFGTGIVKTSEDFGSQGDPPSHPKLLDYLAVDFVQHDWDVKRLMKQMVMSSTYRQSSQASPELIQRDPENRLLARGPRFRLDAEMLRDQALAISGLLDRTMGGPGVKPPQPDGLWFAVGYSSSNTVRFKADEGPSKVFRRSVYTFWKRTAPPPQMNTFDAPSREECRVRRERTNTPLQALLLMNEPQYVESARNLAQLTIDQRSPTDDGKLQWMFTRAMGRAAKPDELTILNKSLLQHRREFSQATDDAAKLLSIGTTQVDTERYDVIELASLTMVANLIMNADEFVCKN